MKDKRKRRTEARYSIKAVDDPPKRIGIVRLNAHRRVGNVGKKQISEICVPVEFDIQRNEISVGDDSLFFYGTFSGLNKNYSRKIDPKTVIKYMLRRTSVLSYGDITGFYLIPIEELQLASSRRELVDETLQKLYGLLPSVTLDKIEIDQNDRRFMKGFRKIFGYYPPELGKRAQENGSYYTAEITRQSTVDEVYEGSNVRVISIPMGGINKWRK